METPTPSVIEYAAGKRPSAIGRFLMRPPGWPMHLLFFLMALWTCWEARLPMHTLDIMFLLMGWVAVLGIWSLRAVLRTALWMVWRRQAPPARWLRWAIGPLMLLASAALFQSHVISNYEFERSRPKLDALASQALASPGFHWNGPAKVGAYEVQRIDAQAINPGEPQVYFYLAEYGGSGGFVYRPNRLPQPSLTDQDMGGGWYAWYHWPT